MGFPQLAELMVSGEPADTSTHTVKVPLTTVPGEMLLLFIGLDGNSRVYEPLAGWTRIAISALPSDALMTCSVFYRIADGNEIDFTYQSIKYDGSLRLRNQQSMNLCLRIAGWNGVAAPYIRLGGGTRIISATSSVHVSGGAGNNTFIAFYFQNRGSLRLGTGHVQRYPRLSINHDTGDNGSPGPGGIAWGIASREHSATDQAWPGGEEIFTTDRNSVVFSGQVVIRGT